MIRCHASWVLPISGPPLRDGWVAIDSGRVVACGRGDRRGLSFEAARDVDLGHVAILPGLVNAHTHLELSHLAGRVPSGPTFVSWIRTVMAARRDHPHPDAPDILTAAERAIVHALRCGTALVGDISNTLVTHGPLIKSPLAAVVFLELIGFNPTDPVAVVEGALEAVRAAQGDDRVRSRLAVHAPYSVAPSVFRAIRQALERERLSPCSVHLAESAEESQFIRDGGGPWRGVLEEVGAWNTSWSPPGVGPVEYLDRMGFLDRDVLAVHGVQMTATDLATLARRGTTLVACPRSNAFTAAGRPPIAAFYASGVRVAVGTDSLASAPDLNVFSELAAMRALAPSVPASRLLDSATRQGADALGFGDDYGRIDPGTRARLLAIDVPASVDDVEEYLVSGIHPDQVRWVDGDIAEGRVQSAE